MANKIVSLSRNVKKNTELEVYSDVDMFSDVKGNNKNRPDYIVTKDINIKAIYNSLGNIFSWIPGERILDPEFGSKLRLYLYEGITDYNKEKIASEVQFSCQKWEPRVKILKIIDMSSVEDHEDNIVRLDVIFTVPTLSEEQYRYSYTYNRTA